MSSVSLPTQSTQCHLGLARDNQLNAFSLLRVSASGHARAGRRLAHELNFHYDLRPVDGIADDGKQGQGGLGLWGLTMASLDNRQGEGFTATREPLARACHVPGYIYTSSEIYAQEIEKIFMKDSDAEESRQRSYNTEHLDR